MVDAVEGDAVDCVVDPSAAAQKQFDELESSAPRRPTLPA
jgi:hypothetical protein